MGLDACVYKNINNIKNYVKRDCLEVDDKTGEVVWICKEKSPLSRDDLFAAVQRIGNIDKICVIRQLIANHMGNKKSYIIEKILYSASHAGDIIPINENILIRNEINELKKINDCVMWEFLKSIEMLIDASEKEGNPIIFI